MIETHFVRDLPARHDKTLGAAKTGDRLSDGSVLLLRQDMDRMGLNNLRSWLSHHVLEGNAVITVLDDGFKLRAPLFEEFAV